VQGRGEMKGEGEIDGGGEGDGVRYVSCLRRKRP